MILTIIILLTLCALTQLFIVGKKTRNTRISYEYIDNYNVLNKQLLFGIYNEKPIKGRYIIMYGTVDRPFHITKVKVNGILIPFQAMGIEKIILDKNRPNEYKLIQFDLKNEYDIQTIEINTDPKTTKTLQNFKVLIRDINGSKVWQSQSFLKSNAPQIIESM